MYYSIYEVGSWTYPFLSLLTAFYSAFSLQTTAVVCQMYTTFGMSSFMIRNTSQ